MRRALFSVARTRLRKSRAAALALSLSSVGLAVGAVPVSSNADQSAVPVGFAAPVLVDPQLGGGEPVIISSHKFGTLVYSSHEGTTHLYRPGLAAHPGEFACPDPATATCYNSHVNIWYSTDHGQHWSRSNGLERLGYTGFSDPDLTEDDAGNLYDTGIGALPDAQASLFSSADGGKTWPTGTTQCHDGDRPWLVGGRPNQVFYAITPAEDWLERRVFVSNDAGASCSTSGSPDSGHSVSLGPVYTGQGKPLLDRHDGSLIGPQGYFENLSLQNRTGIGISRLPDAANAVKSGTNFSNIYHRETTVQNFFQPRLAMDAAENLYLVYAPNDRVAGSTGGCSGASTPVPSRIRMVVGKHTGPGHWNFSEPINISGQLPGQDLWPWVVAGDAGKVSVVWFHRDRFDDIDCGQLNGKAVNSGTFVYEATITDATNPSKRAISVVNASGRSIHQGGICQGGTLCVATGRDRRLGDFLTNALDARGCVLIASGDTEVPEAQGQATSRPIFMSQNSGEGLTGGDCGGAGAAREATMSTGTRTLPNTGRAGYPPGLGRFVLGSSLEFVIGGKASGWPSLDPGMAQALTFVVLVGLLIFGLLYFMARRLRGGAGGPRARLAAGASIVLGVIGLGAFFVLYPIHMAVAQGGVGLGDRAFELLTWLTDYFGLLAALLGLVAGVVGVRSARHRLATVGLLLSSIAVPGWYVTYFLSHAD